MPSPRLRPCCTRARKPALSTRPRLATLALALALLVPLSSNATTPLPFTPGLSQRIDDTFYGEDGKLSPAKLADYRQRMEDRQRETFAVLTSHYARRNKPGKARNKGAKKKISKLYARITGSKGWIAALEEEQDPILQRRIAAHLLEFDRALLVAGKRPHSLEVIDYLTWIALKPWDIPTRSSPRGAAREAVNLVDPQSREFFEVDEVRALLEAGEDLSLLSPPANSTYWNDPGAVATRRPIASYRTGGDPLHRNLRARFPKQARLLGIRKTQTKPKFELDVGNKRSTLRYKLKLGGEIHSEPTANALLATLGFNVDITQHVKNYRLEIADDFDVGELRKEWRSYFEGYRTHLSYSFDDHLSEGRDEQGRFLRVKAGLLEEKRKLLERVGPFDFGDLGNEGRREVRALGVFSSWIRNTDLKEYGNNKLVLRQRHEIPALYHVHHDLGHSLGGMLPEKPNAMSWDWARRRLNGDLRLDYFSAQPNRLRGAITWADARWMGRLIGQLTRGQIREAVDYGGWPRPAAELIVEKLISRRNDMMESLELLGEATPSGPIELIPVNRELSTPDGALVDGVLIQDRYPESTIPLANYWEALLRPVLDKALLAAVAVVQSSVGQVVELVFDDRSVGLPRGIVIEIVIQLRRDVEPNPDPRSYDDYFIARDLLRIGLRLGGGFVGRGEATIWRQYTMLQPFGTESEARFARGTIIDLLLPLHARRGELPSDYVLMRETFMDGRVRAISDDLSGGALPVGAEASLGRSRTRRDIISRLDERVRIFEDVTLEDEAAYRAFVKAVWVRIPLLIGSGGRGSVEGNLFVLDEAFAADDAVRAEAEAALHALLRDGDSSGIEAFAPPRRVSSKFRERKVWAGVFDILQTSRWNRVDHISLGDPEEARHFTQYAGEHFEGWAFLDFGEESRARVHAVVPADEEESAQLELRFHVDDLDVWQNELEGAYLPFANRLAEPVSEDSPARAHTLAEETRLLPLTPSLHSYNQRWGHLRIETVLGFPEEAVDALAALEADALWQELGSDPELDAHEVERARRALTLKNPVRRRVKLRRVPSHIQRIATRTQHTLRKLEAAGASGERSERFRHIVDALETGIFKTGDTWDPAILGALRRSAGPELISIDAKISPPPWRENTLVGDVPLRGSTHWEATRPPHGPVLFNPQTPIDEYRMLDRLTDAAGSAETGGDEAPPPVE